MKDWIVVFRRYRDALKRNAHIEWGMDKVDQWEGDRAFFNKEYNSRRRTSFDDADKCAHEALFLRCAQD